MWVLSHSKGSIMSPKFGKMNTRKFEKIKFLSQSILKIRTLITLWNFKICDKQNLPRRLIYFVVFSQVEDILWLNMFQEILSKNNLD